MVSVALEKTTETDTRFCSTITDADLKKAQERHDMMISELLAVGIVTQHHFKQEREMATRISKHLAPRLGLNVYQVANFSFPIITVDGMVKSFGERFKQQD